MFDFMRNSGPPLSFESLLDALVRALGAKFQRLYFQTVEQAGHHKRDILVTRVEQARDRHARHRAHRGRPAGPGQPRRHSARRRDPRPRPAPGAGRTHRRPRRRTDRPRRAHPDRGTVVSESRRTGEVTVLRLVPGPSPVHRLWAGTKLRM